MCKPLGRLYTSSGLGMSHNLPGGAGKPCLEEGCLDYLVEPAATVTQFWMNSRKRMNININYKRLDLARTPNKEEKLKNYTSS